LISIKNRFYIKTQHRLRIAVNYNNKHSYKQKCFFVDGRNDNNHLKFTHKLKGRDLNSDHIIWHNNFDIFTKKLESVNTNKEVLNRAMHVYMFVNVDIGFLFMKEINSLT
jgi:hypothetical protein